MLSRDPFDAGQQAAESAQKEIDGDAWFLYEGDELFASILAKFYCQPEATDWLMRYPKSPRARRKYKGSMVHDRVLAAIHHRIQYGDWRR